MRRAQYRLPALAPGTQDGECALFHFPGQGGSVQANLDRWYGQFEQPDGGSTARRARLESFEASGLPVTLVQVSGTYVASTGPRSGGDPKAGYAMVAGVVETTVGPWFLKCVGPEETIRAAAPSVRALLMTAQP